MKKNSMQGNIERILFASISCSLTLSSLPAANAEDQDHYLSVVPSMVKPLGKAIPAGNIAPVKPVQTTPKANPAATTPATKPANASTAADLAPEAQNGAEGQPADAAAAPKSFYSPVLEQAVKQYRSAPSTYAYSQVLNALKNTLAAAGSFRLSPVILAKDNTYLNDFKPRVLEANGVRVWTFPKAPEKSRALLQWFDVHQQVVGVGRRKKVLTSTSMRFQEMSFAQDMNIKDAGIVATKETGRRLLLAGDLDDGSLGVRSFKMTEAGWQEEADFANQIPAFLTSNVCGRLGFRGSDLVFNVGKMIQITDSSGNKRFLPEAESATYKFLMKNTETGYQVTAAVPNEEPFTAVYQFMQAAAQSRTDVERALVADPKVSSALASLPKYLGLQGRPLDSAAKVVEMSVPPARGNRFRLINIGKDDLIFDVAKIKGQWLIKSIFIAPPDQFLADTSKYFPYYSRFEQKPEAPKEPITSTGGGASVASAVKRK